MEIKGLKSLIGKLAKRVQGSEEGDKKCVVVGFTANYATYVHENEEMKWKGLPRHNGKGFYWDPQGQAQSKFLEAPARQYAKEIGEICQKAYKVSNDVLKALLAGGMKLQREAMLRTPVDTGNLKASAFTRVEDLP